MVLSFKYHRKATMNAGTDDRRGTRDDADGATRQVYDFQLDNTKSKEKIGVQ